MRKTLPALIAATAIALTGCSAGTTSETPAPATIAETTTAQPATNTLDGNLLNQMQQVGIPTGNLTNTTAVDTGKAICEAADSGISNPSLLAIVEDHMVQWDTADSVIALELTFLNLCPEHATI